MSVAASYNDVSIPYGSRTVHIFSAAAADLGTYVAENITISRPDTILKRKDEIGGPNGSVGIPDFAEGTATIQLATSSTVIPQSGAYFAATFVTAIGSETFIIHSVDQPETQDAYKKVNVKLIKKYN